MIRWQKRIRTWRSPLGERKIGGLGIYMVKKSMDEITYEYRDGQNILRIKKAV